MKLQIIVLNLMLLISLSISAQVIDIADAKLVPVGSTVTVQGIVTDDGQFNGSLRYIQDATGGIAVYDPDFVADLESGTEIQITGGFNPFNELSEITELTDMVILNYGQPLPTPVAFDNITDAFDEAYEGMLLTFNDVTFIDGGTFGSGSANYDISDGSNIQAIRIWAGTDIAGTPIPSEPINITGIMGQYQTEYQFQPLGLSSFDFNPGAPIFSTGLTQHNITTTSFDICFQTINDGTTIINYSPNPNFLSGEVSDMTFTTDHCVTLTNLQPATVYYVQGTSAGANGEESESGVQVMMTSSLSSGEMQVYFNRPVDNSASSGTNAIFVDNALADTIISFIQKAEETLDIALYNVDNDNFLIDAINEAYNNGIAVRVVTHQEMNSAAYSAIQVGAGNKTQSPAPGFQNAPSGGSYGLMHNKFMIIDANSGDPDKCWVTTGSTNYTDQQINTDANNFIAIQDQSLAKAFQLEFNEMFVDNVYGPEKSDNTPKQFVIDGKQVELFFSPSDDTERAIKEKVNSAETDLYVAMLAYTRFGISFEIEALLDDDVFVAGIIEQVNTSDNAMFAFEILNDVIPDNWLADDNSYTLHHKYMIVDPNNIASDPLVLTGSHNWSSSAQFSNDENTLIIHDATIANIYYQEWRRRYTDNGGTIFIGILDDFESNKIEIFDLFPNPTSGNITFAFKIDSEVAYDLEITDINGKVLRSDANLISNTGLNHQQFDLSGYSKGVYIINFRSSNFSHSKKLILR